MPGGDALRVDALNLDALRADALIADARRVDAQRPDVTVVDVVGGGVLGAGLAGPVVRRSKDFGSDGPGAGDRRSHGLASDAVAAGVPVGGVAGDRVGGSGEATRMTPGFGPVRCGASELTGPAGGRDVSGRGPGVQASVGQWFVIHTLSRQEKALADDLLAMGVEHFLPLHRVVRFYGKRKVVVEEPLFPGYLFLCGRRDDAFRADRTRRVASILSVSDQASLIEDLAQVKLALASRETLLPSSLLEVGVRVEVTAGALKGLRGKVTRVDSRSRLVMSVDLIGRAASLEIDGSLLRVIG